jgi:hypothetical protein
MTKIFSNNRMVGEVVGDTFKKELKPNHFLRKPPAIAFGVQSLVDAKKAGATKAEITNTDTGKVYRATLDVIERDGFPIERGGWEPQRALPLYKWQVTAKDINQLALL